MANGTKGKDVGSPTSGGQLVEKTSEFEVLIYKETYRFMQASGLGASVRLTELPNPNSGYGPKIAREGRTSGRIEFSKGSGKWAKSVQDWIWQSLDPNQPLKRMAIDVVIKPKQKSRVAERTFKLMNAFPVEWSGPLLNTESTQMTIERVVFSFEALVFDAKGKGDEGAQAQAPSISNGDKTVHFPLPPRFVQVQHASEFATHEGPGLVRPHLDYQHGSARVLKTELVVDWDVLGEGAESSAVYAHTDDLQSLMVPDPSTKEPKVVTFSYGERRFEGHISALDTRIEKFASNGMPTRAVYAMTMIESSTAPAIHEKEVF